MILLSFHSDPKIKAKYLKRVREHELNDEIVKGVYWENGKGCALGCSVHSADHKAYEIELGLPEWLAHLEDVLFEGLPNEEAKKFPAAFLEAIPVGVNLDPVRLKFSTFMLEENMDQVSTSNIDKEIKEQVISAVRGALLMYQGLIETGSWNESTAATVRELSWFAVATAGGAAKRAAEDSAWHVAAKIENASRSARTAAWSAVDTVKNPATSTRWSVKGADRSIDYMRYAEHLLTLLKTVK